MALGRCRGCTLSTKSTWTAGLRSGPSLSMTEGAMLVELISDHELE